MATVGARVVGADHFARRFGFCSTGEGVYLSAVHLTDAGDQDRQRFPGVENEGAFNVDVLVSQVRGSIRDGPLAEHGLSPVGELNENRSQCLSPGHGYVNENGYQVSCPTLCQFFSSSAVRPVSPMTYIVSLI